MNLAFDHFSTLLSRLNSSFFTANHNPLLLSYCSVLVSELAYQVVDQLEIDTRRRVKWIPSDANQEIRIRGSVVQLTDLPNIRPLEGEEGEPSFFSVRTSATVILGVSFPNTLFLGFRGTNPLSPFDLNINFDNSPFEVSVPCSTGKAYVHSGYYNEAMRVSSLLLPHLELWMGRAPQNSNNRPRVYISGHSLGGAVAALFAAMCGCPTRGEFSIPLSGADLRSVCIFGAPRFANQHFLFSQKFCWKKVGDCGFKAHIHVRNAGDIVPRLWSRSLADGGFYERICPDGAEFRERVWLDSTAAKALPFLLSRFRPHKIERYRELIGMSGGFSDSHSPLTHRAERYWN